MKKIKRDTLTSSKLNKTIVVTSVNALKIDVSEVAQSDRNVIFNPLVKKFSPHTLWSDGELKVEWLVWVGQSVETCIHWCAD